MTVTPAMTGGGVRPNILLVVVDCGRADKWLERPRRVTPTLDKLRATGITLPNTIVEKACTTPSFTGLLTGSYSPAHGVHNVWGDRLADDVPLLTHALTAAGYHTYAEVTGPLLPETGLARGFEQYRYRAPSDYLNTPWGDEFVARLRGGGYAGPWFVMLHLWELHPERLVAAGFDDPRYGDDSYDRSIAGLDAQLARVFEAVGDAALVFTADHGEKLRSETYHPGTAVAYARELLQIDRADGLVPFHVAHWAGPSVLQQLYGAGTAMLRDLDLKALQPPRFDRWTYLRDRLRLLWLTPWLTLRDLLALATPRKLTEMLHRSELLNADRSRQKVARFRRVVGDERLLDMHLRMWLNSYKHNLDEGHMLHVYDFLVRVPLVIRWPGSSGTVPPATASAHPPGATINRMVRQVDILPTILDLLGISRATSLSEPQSASPQVNDPAPRSAIGDPAEASARLGGSRALPERHTRGRSFAPLLRGQAWEAAPAYVSVSGLPRDLELRGVRTEQYKYTYGPHNADLPQELYDLQADPGEVRNLAAQDPQRCTELRRLANAFVPSTPQRAATPMTVSAADQARIEQQLRDLGYLA